MEAHLAAPVHFCPARCFSKLKSDAYRFCTQAMELVRGVALARLSMPCLTCQVLHVCAMCAWCKLPWRQAFQNTHAPSAGAYGAGAHAMLGSSTLAGTGAACGPAPALTPPLSLVLGASAPGESFTLNSRATIAVWQRPFQRMCFGAYGAGAHAMLGSSTLAGAGAACLARTCPDATPLLNTIPHCRHYPRRQ